MSFKMKFLKENLLGDQGVEDNQDNTKMLDTDTRGVSLWED
jgi:hypothetical protein